MKKAAAVLAALVMLFGLASCIPGRKEDFHVGLVLSDFEDEFQADVRSAVIARAGDWSDMEFTAINSKGDAEIQGKNLELTISQKYDLVAVYDLTNTPDALIAQFKAANIPLIIWNSGAPSDAALDGYEQSW